MGNCRSCPLKKSDRKKLRPDRIAKSDGSSCQRQASFTCLNSTLWQLVNLRRLSEGPPIPLRIADNSFTAEYLLLR